MTRADRKPVRGARAPDNEPNEHATHSARRPGNSTIVWLQQLERGIKRGKSPGLLTADRHGRKSSHSTVSAAIVVARAQLACKASKLLGDFEADQVVAADEVRARCNRARDKANDFQRVSPEPAVLAADVPRDRWQGVRARLERADA